MTDFIDRIKSAFDSGAANLTNELNVAEGNLEASPSDPSVLANYQARLAEYTLYRNAQTSTVKAYKDIASAIIQNFR